LGGTNNDRLVEVVPAYDVSEVKTVDVTPETFQQQFSMSQPTGDTEALNEDAVSVEMKKLLEGLDREIQLEEWGSQLEEWGSQLAAQKSQLDDRERKLKDKEEAWENLSQERDNEIEAKQATLNGLEKEIEAARTYKALLKAKIESSEVDLTGIANKVQSKFDDLMALREACPVPDLATIVGSMLNKLAEPEMVFLLSTVAEWAREEAFVVLPPHVDRRIRKCLAPGASAPKGFILRIYCLFNLVTYILHSCFCRLDTSEIMFNLNACQRYINAESGSTNFIQPFVDLIEIAQYYEDQFGTAAELEAALEAHASKYKRFWRIEETHCLDVLEHLSNDLCKLAVTHSPSPSSKLLTLTRSFALQFYSTQTILSRRTTSNGCTLSFHKPTSIGHRASLLKQHLSKDCKLATFISRKQYLSSRINR